MFLTAAAIYMLLDLPVQLTGFFPYGSFIGMKNFLPAILGMLLGPYGVSGACMGCAAGAMLLDTPIREAAFECCTIVIVGLTMWLGWHAGSTTCKIHFKRWVHYLKYAGLVVLSAAVCGVLSGVFLPESAMVKVFAAYTAFSLLVGIPVQILANGIFWFQAVLPPWCHVTPVVEGTIDAAPDSISLFNEALEDAAFQRKIGMKQLFEVQNCVEEVSIRVLAACPETKISLRFDYDDTSCLWFSYPGARYNPLQMRKDEDELDLMGLRLIRHRALRASYSYAGGKNHIHIVV